MVSTLWCSVATSAQSRQPSTTNKPWVVQTKKQVGDIQRVLAGQSGNKNQDIVSGAGNQTRVAVFHDEKRENDVVEVHDAADDIYVVLDGEATLLLGGTVNEAKEISVGEWRGKSSTGGTNVRIKKGDVVFIPRGTAHQRTVAGKDFTMILIKVFATEQPQKQ